MHAFAGGFLVGIGLLFGTFTPAVAQAPPAIAEVPGAESDPGLASYREQLEAAKTTAFELGHSAAEWIAADATLVAALADPLFARLPAREQAQAISGAGWAALRLEDYPRARDLLARATQLDPEDGDNLIWLAKLENKLHNEDAAALALAAYVRKWPLRDSEAGFVTELAHGADAGSPALLALLQTLFDKDWNPKPAGASHLWYKLALARVRLDQPEAAAEEITRITTPEMLVRLRSDKRFDALVDASLERFNVERAASRRVDELRVQAILHPEHLENLVAMTRAMLMDGMPEAVLDVTNRILTAHAGNPDGDVFADSTQIPWVMNNRSTAFNRLGRTEEALAQLENSARLKPDGAVNVNQTLNLSQFYCGLGRADDASAAAALAGPSMNDYGKLVQKLAEHCAAELKGDKARAAQALAYLREHRRHGQFTYLLALLRANLIDEAARIVIELLVDEETRGQMLFESQEFLQSKPLPANVELDARWVALMARADVREAIDAVGRTQRYEIHGR